MGRAKADIPTGSFFLRAPQTSKKATFSNLSERLIYLRYFVGGKYVMRSTDIAILPEDWDQKAQTVRNRNKSATRINNRLKAFRKRVDDQLLAHTGACTPKLVQEMLDSVHIAPEEKASGVMLIVLANEVNEQRYKANAYGYSVFYNNKCYIKQFGAYLREKNKDEDIALSNVSLDLFSKYAVWQLDEKGKKSREGVNKTLTPFINALRYARDNGILNSAEITPVIDKIYIPVKERAYNPNKEDDAKIRYLDKEQFAQLKAYTPRSNRAAATQDILDIFFFSYYACGLRISDIITLEWSQIDLVNKRINKTQVKTKKKGKVSPILTDDAISILEKWKGRNERFVFNYLPKDYDFEDPHAFKMRCNTVDRTINMSLNAIGENLKLPFSLTIHVARHTFCVNAIKAGMSLHVISQLMGHSSILATEKTYADFLEETVNNEIEKLKKLDY